MWVEFVVGSRHAPRVFLRVPKFSEFSGFPPSTKPTSQNSNSTRITDPHKNQVRLMCLPPSLKYVLMKTLDVMIDFRQIIALSKLHIIEVMMIPFLSF